MDPGRDKKSGQREFQKAIGKPVGQGKLAVTPEINPNLPTRKRVGLDKILGTHTPWGRKDERRRMQEGRRKRRGEGKKRRHGGGRARLGNTGRLTLFFFGCLIHVLPTDALSF
jgi:hypothetical protein